MIEHKNNIGFYSGQDWQHGQHAEVSNRFAIAGIYDEEMWMYYLESWHVV